MKITLLTYFLCLLISPVKADNVNYKGVVYIIPPNGYQNEKLFDMQDTVFNRDDCMRPFFDLRETLRSLGYDLKTTILEHELTNMTALLVCGIPYADSDIIKHLKKYPREKIISLILEPPTVVPYYYEKANHNLFGKIFIMLDNYVDNNKYFKLYYPQTTLKMIQDPINFEQKKLCTLIAGNHSSSHPDELYSERKTIINFFEHYAPADFDFYGHNWSKELYGTYGGRVLSKIKTLKNYKFCICYENMKNVEGYITEKIFDVFISGTVPIYWGAKNITQFIPKKCFISRQDFKSDLELYKFLKTITKDQYNIYIENIKEFLVGPQAYLFSKEHFINTLINACMLTR